MGVSSLEASVNGLDNFSHLVCTSNSSFRIMEMPKPMQNPQQQQQQPWPPLRCPRCNSTNTKFCYYNNYSKSQPRYLCKACRRHWTEGGTLRDVPVGGGRKNKRTKAATTNPTSSAAASTSNSSEVIMNTANNSVVQRLLNGSPSSSVLPEILREVLLQPAQQMFSLPFQPLPPTVSPDFGMMSSLLGPREVVCNNLGSYTSGLNNTLSTTYGYAQMDTGGMMPPMQLGPGNWSSLDNDISGLANPDKKPPTSEGC